MAPAHTRAAAVTGAGSGLGRDYTWPTGEATTVTTPPRRPGRRQAPEGGVTRLPFEPRMNENSQTMCSVPGSSSKTVRKWAKSTWA